MTVSRTICLGFLVLITIGTLLLWLPFSTATGEWNTFVTSLFTATSAVCVTGLIVVDTGSYYSGFGNVVILLLIQVGGLGYMTATTFLLILLGRRFGLKEKLAIQKSLDLRGLSSTVQLVRSIIALTLVFELFGIITLFPVFRADYGVWQGLGLAIFHSISAFNNAGFSLFSDSLTQYATSVPVNIIIPALILLGGLGYQVIMELYLWIRDRLSGKATRRRFSLNFKIAISTSAILLVIGTLVLLATEYRNVSVFGDFSPRERLLIAWFHSVMPRTAGFNSVDYGAFTTTGLLMTIALMFIGANPGSTGGGIKTTTFRILFSSTKAVLENKEDVLCYQRQIPNLLILKAVGVVFASGLTVISVTSLLAIGNPEIEFMDLLFEAVSAFATVGLSTGITAQLTLFSKLIIILTMYIGRVGVLLLISAFLGESKPSVIHYPEE
ncbi:MAG: TrkH family potassium uptake protein, partial [Leptolyngbyaceae bacterium]|nr:TrkH family potassium uptake protein [Leptolyngbyaceae bacterium]